MLTMPHSAAALALVGFFAAAWPAAATAQEASATAQAAQPRDDVLRAELLAEFRARLAADVAADSVGSMAAAVVVGDSVVWLEAFGGIQGATGPAATPGTIYRIGSLTKMVTALLLMRLVEKGAVDLDEPVAVRVPEIVGLAGLETTHRPITYRHLASHTAGLEREPSSTLAGRGRRSGWDRRTLDAIPLTEVRFPPGEAYRYSNIGYAILGLALERAGGEPFERLVVDEVLRPLGMLRTSFGPPAPWRGRLATGYVNLDGGAADPRVPRAEHRGRGFRIPGEGLYSTASDLARLILALYGAGPEGALDDEVRSALLADHDPDGDDRAGYGLGLQLTRLGGTLLAGHSGTVPGYASYLVFDPERRIGVVLLRSYNQGRSNLAAEAQRLVLDLGASR